MFLLTPPTLQIVDTAAAKLAARIDDTRFDALLPAWIDAGRAMAEQYCNRAFAQQVWREELEHWPDDTVRFPIYRPTAVAIAYWDGSAWQTLTPDTHFVHFPDGSRTGVARALGTSWPALGSIAAGPRVRIDFTAGATTAAAVPAAVQQFVVAHLALWVDAPEAASDRELKPAPYLMSLLDPYRIF